MFRWFDAFPAHSATRMPDPSCKLPITRVQLDASHAGQASRALSTARLHMLPCFHLPPINVLVSHGPSEGFTPWECSS